MATMTTIREVKKMNWAAHMAFGSSVLIGVGVSPEAAIAALGGVMVSAMRALRFSGEVVPDFSAADIWFEDFLELLMQYKERPYQKLLLKKTERESETASVES
jgi:hypothetical protein